MIGDEDRLLAEALPQLIWITDPDGSVIYVNRRYIEYTGYSLEELCGPTEWRKALHPDDLERCLADWHTATRSGTGYETEYRLRRAADATWRWHLARALPVKDDAGRVLRWVGTCTDIEEHKRIQEQLHEFLAMLGHELRNPLAPILGAVSLLKDKSALGHAHLDIIERQARQMARLVDDLLDVARISRGAIHLRPERIELATVIERAIETAMPLISERGHTLVMDVAPGLVVDADPLRLGQVLANLLNNAAKYTQDRGVVTVRASRDGERVALSVRDTGTGIPAAQLPHVFDLFVQGERTLDRRQGGLGVGLTLVKRLVEMHGGRVTAASDGPGRGSEFVVNLPAAAPAPEREPPPPPVIADPQARRVLVVDDNADIVSVLRDYLTWKGFDVHVAFDGISALDVAYEAHPEIVLLDIGLPHLDGYEVARRLRSDERFAATRLIALTGYGQSADVERARRSGFHAHLVKPLDFTHLVDLVTARS
jgi:PAS domain S-box-containing protein